MALYVAGSELTGGAAVASSWKNVGSYCFAMVATLKYADQTHAASTSYRLYPCNPSGTYQTSTTSGYYGSGTWRCMGHTAGYLLNGNNATLWHRIS
tara:strand:+ start:141 stop:428 length:288 start_codon:yes stop_codon:yes gene_type:complete